MLSNIIMIIVKVLSFIALWAIAEMTVDNFRRIYRKRCKNNQI